MKLIDYGMIPKKNYEGEVKIKDMKIRCYTPKQIKDMYPNGDGYRIVGESKAKNRKKIIGNLPVENGEKPLGVSNPGTYSKLLYRYAGYVAVGEDEYIALLKMNLAFLLIIFTLLLAIMGTTIILSRILERDNTTEVLNPLPPIDINGDPIEDDETEKVESEEGGGFVSLVYQLSASLDLSTGIITIYYENPNKSNQDVALELYAVSGDKEVLIAQSGRLQPGYALSQMTLSEDKAALFSSGATYEGKFKAVYYNSETGERALIETEIVDVRISVQ